MMNILVPVDFYKTSFAAYSYACHLAQNFEDSKITLLHVINGSFNTHDVITFDPMVGKQKAAQNRLAYFATDYATKLGITLPEVQVSQEVLFGIPGFAITDYATSKDVDLIVMGTRDKHSLFDRLLGSASAIAVRTANCPVMLIHQGCKYNNPKNIVFAFDAKSDIEDAVEDYKIFNNSLKAKTDFVHVKIKDKVHPNLAKQTAELIDELFDNDDPNFSFEIKTIEGSNISTALMDYCLHHKAEILAMMHRKEGLFQTLFRANHSVKIAQEFHLPVLVFHEDN